MIFQLVPEIHLIQDARLNLIANKDGMSDRANHNEIDNSENQFDCD